MMETRTLTCIGCPLGCTLKAELEGNTVRSVTGNTCPNGEILDELLTRWEQMGYRFAPLTELFPEGS